MRREMGSVPNSFNVVPSLVMRQDCIFIFIIPRILDAKHWAYAANDLYARGYCAGGSAESALR